MTHGLNQKEQALLNKIYRAVHDGVCPKCGKDIAGPEPVYKPSGDPYGEYAHRCGCGFVVTSDEMRRMRAVIAYWGAEAVAFFEHWRTR